MVEDPKWELALLATVQSFYQRLLSNQLGGELPAPAEIEAMAARWKPYCTVASWYLWRSLEPNANL